MSVNLSKSQKLFYSVISQELNILNQTFNYNLNFFFFPQTLQMDVNKLNITLLRIFRQGVAAALGLLPQQVHINRLIVRCLHFTFPEQALIFFEGLNNKEQ